MAVEPFVDFVVDQALAIAVGVIALAAAPALAPKVAAAVQDATQGARAAGRRAQEVGARAKETGSALAARAREVPVVSPMLAAVGQPVTKAGRSIRARVNDEKQARASTRKGENMSACSYNFELPVDPIALLGMVARMITENGGRITGDVPDVSMSMPTPIGQVEGTCRLLSGSVVNLTVTKKPDILTCAMVRDKLVFYITEAVKLYAAQSKAQQVPA
jgi:hypothetical protein